MLGSLDCAEGGSEGDLVVVGGETAQGFPIAKGHPPLGGDGDIYG